MVELDEARSKAGPDPPAPDDHDVIAFRTRGGI
jgi:hypothetical protein